MIIDIDRLRDVQWILTSKECLDQLSNDIIRFWSLFNNIFQSLCFVHSAHAVLRNGTCNVPISDSSEYHKHFYTKNFLSEPFFLNIPSQTVDDLNVRRN